MIPVNQHAGRQALKAVTSVTQVGHTQKRKAVWVRVNNNNGLSVHSTFRRDFKWLSSMTCQYTRHVRFIRIFKEMNS